jgi:hypothetical protein
MASARLRRNLGRALLLVPASGPRVARVALAAWLLALAGIWATQQVHMGLHEGVDLPPLLHLLRDAALAVPFAAASVALGGLIAGEVVRGRGGSPDGLLGRIAWAVVAALVFAALSVPGNEVHALLFGAQEEGDLLLDLLNDASLVLAASLAILGPLSLTPVAPWPPALEDDQLHALTPGLPGFRADRAQPTR